MPKELNEVKSSEVRPKHDTGSTLSNMSSRQRHELTAQFAKDAARVEQAEHSAQENDQSLGDKATSNPQETTDSQTVVNDTRDKAGSSQPIETENKSYLQKFVEVAYDWIERFKVENPNIDPKKDREKITQYNSAARLFNENLRKLEKFGITKLREIIPIEIRLLGGTERIESEVLASPEWNSDDVQEELNKLKGATRRSAAWNTATGDLMYAFRDRLQESSLPAATQIERANKVRDLIQAGRWGKEPTPNPETSEYTIGRPTDIFEDNDQGW